MVQANTPGPCGVMRMLTFFVSVVAQAVRAWSRPDGHDGPFERRVGTLRLTASTSNDDDDDRPGRPGRSPFGHVRERDVESRQQRGEKQDDGRNAVSRGRVA